MNIHHDFRTDENGNPAGGQSIATGVCIGWQNGPLRDPAGNSVPRNGAFVDEVIQIAIDRLNFYQDSKFNCVYNADAIEYLEKALARLNDRTADRVKREVEGTHAE